MDLRSGATSFGICLSDEQLQQFIKFEDALYESNAVMNLTRVPREECWWRHFLESLILSPSIPKGATVLDIGSGPGFPGAALQIARPDLTVTCVDSHAKSVEFLRKVFPSLQVIQSRAEDLTLRESFDIVTGRAIAPFPIQAEISAAWIKIGGKFIPIRTPIESDKIRKLNVGVLGLSWLESKIVSVGQIGIERLLPIFEKWRTTPETYPRTWAQIKSKPIGGKG